MDYVFDWQYEHYLLIGGYGSGKSYQTANKIILICLQEKRKVLVLRNTYESIKESCFDLFCEILEKHDMLTTAGSSKAEKVNRVIARTTPMELVFPNGSRIIFKGLDSVEKVRSINGVSIMWIEEASEINYATYLELTGRVRTPEESMHFILTCNPVSRENWIYTHFFQKLDERGRPIVFMDEEIFYQHRTVVRGKLGDPGSIYYHHSQPSDNPYLPAGYIKRLQELRNYDPYLYRVAMFGRFGVTGLRVLPQFEIANDATKFRQAVTSIPYRNHYFGFDFGFEGSYNCLLSMAVDVQNKILYIYDEIYINNITDDKMATLPKMQALKVKQQKLLNDHRIIRPIVADSEDPKAISFYRNAGFIIRKTNAKWNGSKLSNTRKVKRFKHIYCSPKCHNTIRELANLSYKQDAKGNIKYDVFNIDAHSMSAIWYGLDLVNVSDVKDYINNSRSGNSEEVTARLENSLDFLTERQKRAIGARTPLQQRQYLEANGY